QLAVPPHAAHQEGGDDRLLLLLRHATAARGSPRWLVTQGDQPDREAAYECGVVLSQRVPILATVSDGRVVSKDCNICHTLLGQEENGATMAASPKLTFQHPADLGDIAQVNCSDCHTGGAGP